MSGALSRLVGRVGLGASDAPRLSVVVVVYDMAPQAARTLASLAPGYQRDADPEDYEVVVVENRSADTLGEDRARQALGGVPLRYIGRDETLPSPVGAANAGLAAARAPLVALMIDGARMLTPGVVAGTLAAHRADPGSVISAPAYHLGDDLQQVTVNRGHDAAADTRLLDGIGWPADGYRLFEVAVWSGSARRGFLRPHSESNYLAAPRAHWDRVGGLDPRYDSHGGGKCNLDLYKRMLEETGAPLTLLFAEGSFHQVHGGVTTNTAGPAREAVMEAIRDQDAAIRGEGARPPVTPARLYGTPHPAVMPFLRASLAPPGKRGKDAPKQTLNKGERVDP